MNWKDSLDKYLTTPPNDGFDNWIEDVLGNKITDTFYNENEKWIEENDGLCEKWLNYLFDRGKTPTEAAEIVERAFNIYFKSKTSNTV
jgi:hypothetical protein